MNHFPGLTREAPPDRDVYRPAPFPVSTEPEAGGAFGMRRGTLIDQFPGTRSFVAGATVIPAPSAYTAQAGQAAWYGLREIRAERDTPTEFSLLAVFGSMLATDPDGNGGNSGATNPQAWGATDGTGAAIVVGIDLPVRPGQWATAPVAIPGLGGYTNTGDDARASISRFVGVFEFPPGKINDDVKAKLYPALPFAPGAVRVLKGQRLGVAFVVNGATAQAAAGASNNFGLYARLNLNVGLTQEDTFQAG